jgi:hypothetical protein
MTIRIVTFPAPCFTTDSVAASVRQSLTPCMVIAGGFRCSDDDEASSRPRRVGACPEERAAVGHTIRPILTPA